MICHKKMIGKGLNLLKTKRFAGATYQFTLEKRLEKDLPSFISELCQRQNPVFFIIGVNSSILDKVTCQRERCINDADEICAHNFDLLGSGKTDVSKLLPMQAEKRREDVNVAKRGFTRYRPIDWHRDFKSGVSWDRDVLYIDTVIIKGDGSDIKVPWELSRFQHLPTLGIAYWLTGNEKYVREFIDEINDWIDNNPPHYGVNWTCSMDIAIRVVNWIWGYYFFKDSPEVTEEFLVKFFKSLLIHGRHIRANLERASRIVSFGSALLHGKLPLDILRPGWRGINNNHYLSDIVGLIYLGVLFPEFKDAKGWRDFGIKELIREMEGQVYPDGVDYEGSISYHRLMTELFLSSTLLCLKNGINFPEWYMNRLEKILEFIMYYTKPDGTAPQINDNDDGRLHILSDYGNWDRTDHRYLLSVGAVLYERSDFKQAVGKFHEEAFWLLGEEGLKKFEELPVANEPLCSKAFPDGGFYIMRDKVFYLIIDAVPADPASPSGHKHNSRLSFELCAYGETFIVDPGAYIYTADSNMRNLFRSTAYHNTVVVDGEEQNSLDPANLFWTGNEAKVKINAWQVSKDYDFWDEEHYGYTRLKEPVVHRRQVYFDKEEHFWVVKDIFIGKGLHQFKLFFHFRPLRVDFLADDLLAAVAHGSRVKMAVIPLLKESLQAEIFQGWISPRYGVKEEAPVLRYYKEAALPARFYTLLYPYLKDIDIGRVKEKALQRIGNLSRD